MAETASRETRKEVRKGKGIMRREGKVRERRYRGCPEEILED